MTLIKCKLCGLPDPEHVMRPFIDHAFLPDNGKYHFSEPAPKQQYVEERMPGGKLYDDGADWRVMPNERGSTQALIDEAYERWRDGIIKHGDRFLGQPAAHLREELIDALRYNEMTEKQIAWLTGENERLKSNEALRWQTCWCDCSACENCKPNKRP